MKAREIEDRPGGPLATEGTPREPAQRGKRPLTERAKAERTLGLKLVAPAVIAMLLVTAYPIAYAVWLSVQRYDLRFPGERQFVGLANYGSILTSTLWWEDVFNTLFITVVSVGLELVLGMALALIMHRALFARRSVRASVLIPYGIVTVVAAYAWQYAFTPGTGFINQWLNLEEAWLTQRWTSFLVIIAAEVWKTTPFMALLLLAGLTLVPDQLLDAARVDGANAWQRFTKVTLPLMKPAILVALLFRTLDAFRIFDNVFIMTGGANNTETVSILAYRTLINQLNIGMGSALSVLIFVGVIIIAVVFIKGFRVSTDAGRR